MNFIKNQSKLPLLKDAQGNVIQGSYDYQVSHVLAKKYLDTIEAPKKEFFSFANSAHSPNMEEPEKFIEIIRKIALENPLQE